MDAPDPPVVSRHHGLLGTVIELRVWATSASSAMAAERAAIGEIERLQRVFDVHDDRSDLRRRLAGEAVASPELDAVLDLAARWRTRSGGVFDPAVGALVELWDAAANAGAAPSPTAIDRVIAAMHDPTDARSRPSNLNALAKGWIVDRAHQRARALEATIGLTINAGGDLLHAAPIPLIVGIEDPHRPYDNVAPLVRVRLDDGALATSGGARRGWQIGDRWYSHVLDPRTGAPVDHVASASVIAPDAATADVVATVLTVAPIDEGLAFVDGLDDVACCIVTRDGALHRDDRWPRHELTS